MKENFCLRGGQQQRYNWDDCCKKERRAECSVTANGTNRGTF